MGRGGRRALSQAGAPRCPGGFRPALPPPAAARAAPTAQCGSHSTHPQLLWGAGVQLVSRLRTRGSRERRRQGGLRTEPLRQVPPAEMVVLLHAACRHVGVGPAQNARKWAQQRRALQSPGGCGGGTAVGGGRGRGLQCLAAAAGDALGRAAGSRAAGCGLPARGTCASLGTPSSFHPRVGQRGQQAAPACCLLACGLAAGGLGSAGLSLHWRARWCGWCGSCDCKRGAQSSLQSADAGRGERTGQVWRRRQRGADWCTQALLSISFIAAQFLYCFR